MLPTPNTTGRRQEMKWGCVFFVKKVSKGRVFCKKWNMEVFCKTVDLSSTQVALCTVSVFFILHFIYLGVRTHPTDPPAYGPAR